jgi:hypothetical protein
LYLRALKRQKKEIIININRINQNGNVTKH